jgi:GNAT superfamily N-acetyltransferase
MTSADYDIAHYRPEHFDGALTVLAGLWPYERTLAARLFRWRHLENPYVEAPPGVVALHRGQVVGFRGYFAHAYSPGPGNADIVVLHPCDTVVDPGHRNQGLSVAMGRLASEFDPARYRLFMNLTSGGNSRPGYLALGFTPLAPRVTLMRHPWNPLAWMADAWSKRPAKPGRPLSRARVRHGRDGDILVAAEARPAEMAAIIAAERADGPALRLRQDEVFFAWRYRNPVQRYAFYYRMEGEVARAFAVFDISADGRCGSLLDYGEARTGALGEALRHACTSRDFVALSALGYGLDARTLALVRALGFRPVHTLKTLFKRGSVEALAPPILIRPIPAKFDEDAFRIGALDMRCIADWRLKPICSDGA